MNKPYFNLLSYFNLLCLGNGSLSRKGSVLLIRGVVLDEPAGVERASGVVYA